MNNSTAIGIWMMLAAILIAIMDIGEEHTWPIGVALLFCIAGSTGFMLIGCDRDRFEK